MTHLKTAKARRMFVKRNIKYVSGKKLYEVYRDIEKKKGMKK